MFAGIPVYFVYAANRTKNRVTMGYMTHLHEGKATVPETQGSFGGMQPFKTRSFASAFPGQNGFSKAIQGAWLKSQI
jgi:hypothetical protein